MSSMPYRALVTGASGFAGQHLARVLRDQGCEVFGIGLSETMPNLENYRHCDLSRPEAVAQLIQEIVPEVIFHLASLTLAAARNKPIADFYNANLYGTLHLLEAVRKSTPTSRVLLVTSSAMYGVAGYTSGVIDENTPLTPINPYGVSKAAQHLIGYQYFAQYGLDIVRVCPFNLLGPNLPRGLAASDFAYQLVAIERGLQKPTLNVGNLSTARDFVDVRDAVHAYISLIEKGQSGATYNLASGKPVTIRQLLSELIAISGVEVTIHSTEALLRKNEVSIQIGSNQRLAEATGWSPRIPLDTTLRDLLDSYKTLSIDPYQNVSSQTKL